MKKSGVLLVFILLLSLMTPLATANTVNYVEQKKGVTVKYYKDSAGYDSIHKPDGSTLVGSQRYTIEYREGKQWKPVTPYTVDTRLSQVTRKYTDYLGSTAETRYRETDLGIKSDVVIKSAETREYRIVWSLDGIVHENVRYGVNFVEFYDGGEWLRVDWNDAYQQYGEITTYTLDESANGKKIDIIFNVGTVKAGETLVLDPILIDSYTGGINVGGIEDLHPSDSADDSARGQTLTITTGDIYLSNITFYLDKNGAPTGNGSAAIYHVTGTVGTDSKPTGSPLAVSRKIDVSTFSGDYYAFNFTGFEQILLQNGTSYAIAYLNPETGTINAANYVKIQLNATAPTALEHDGNGFYYRNGAWAGIQTWDHNFYLYGIDEPTFVEATDTFGRNELGWVNVTVFHEDGYTNINYVELGCNTTGENFTLRWTEATNTFSEQTDPDSIIDALGNSTRIILDDETLQLCFGYIMTAGTSGPVSVNITQVNDDASVEYMFFPSLYTFSYFNWVDEVYDFINSAFDQFGIINFMSLITTHLEGLSTWFQSSLTRTLELLVQQFRVINAVYGWFIYWSAEMIGIVLTFSEYYHEFLDGTSAWSDALVPWWEFFMGFSDAFPLFGFIWWIDSLSSRAKQTVGGVLQVFLNDMNTAIGLFSYFFGVFTYVANTIIDRIYGLFDAIP